MFIKMPIEKFEFNDNILELNKNIIKYKDLNIDNKVLESLIIKGAYATSLLYLNKNGLIESINDKPLSLYKYNKFLKECKNLLKENSYKSNADNIKPLCTINDLEVFESNDYIYRGKGNKLLVENFRMTKESVENNYTGDSKADEIIFDFSQTERDTNTFTKALNEISRMEYENKINKDKYDECIKKLQDLFNNKDKSIDDLKEECEGTQVTDIAEKKDQDIPLVRVKKKYKENYTFDIDFNHNFKGFNLKESGRYERGNYVLINESGIIKAINKKLLESFNKEILIEELNAALQEGLNSLGYDEEFKKDYCDISIKEDSKDFLKVVFAAELNYREGEIIVDYYLNPVVRKYDSDSYFDAESPGRWISIVGKYKLN